MIHRRAGRAVKSRDGNQRVETRQQRKRILIVCEGEATEPEYFKALILHHRLNGYVDDGTQSLKLGARFDVEGTGRNTLDLVRYAEGRRGSGPDRFDEIWCVFDKDDFDPANFDNAIAKTQGHAYLRVAWSNEAFELWYILHFEYLNSSPAGSGGKPRGYYIGRLHDLMKKHFNRERYSKNDATLYELLGAARQETAILNAYLLAKQYPEETPYHQKKPATTVHIMVEELLRYAAQS